MKKILFPGLIAGVAMLVVGFVVSWLFGLIPSVAAEMKNAALFRPFSDPRMMLYFVYPFLLGIILAWAWYKSKVLFKGSAIARGVNFGMSYGILATIPGMLITWSSFAISGITVIGWLVSGFANAIVAGLILTKMNK
jgi:hypothetical protein